MVKPVKLGRTTRMSFSKIDEALEMPNLIEVQKKSYKWFLDEGPMEVLHDVSPITDYSGNLSIEFVGYHLDSTPKYSVEDARARRKLRGAAACYRAPAQQDNGGCLNVTFSWAIPLMTENGTFIINGAERVIYPR